MRAIRLTLLALALLVPLPLRAGEEESSALSAGVHEAELREHVRTLASDDFEGRRSGTAGGEKAAAYIAARFDAVGLKPLGDEGTYLQRFPLPGGEPVAERSTLTVRAGAGKSESFPMDSLWSAFRGSGAGELRDVEVVFAGYGIHAPDLGYDDFDGVDVKGKVALVLRHGPRQGRPDFLFEDRNRRHTYFAMKVIAAQRAGAAAVILVNDRARREKDDPDPTLGGGAGRSKIPFVFARAKIADAVFGAADLDLAAIEKGIDETGKPASRPLEGVRIDLALEMKSSLGANVLGMVEGSDPKLAAEYVVVGGHYDHLGTDGRGAIDGGGKDRIWNGADDNASGTAGVIELAEHFALASPRPKRSFVFIAFAAEELGLLGSRHYVEHPVVPLEATVAMLNMDMIGRSDGENLFVGGVGTSPAFDDILTAASRDAGLSIRRGQGGAAPSDNTVFFGKGIPTLFFFTGLHADYHRATDDWDKLNYEAEKRIVDVVAGVARAVADLETRPAFVKVSSGGFPGRQRGPYLGVRPDPRPGETGAAVLEVVPGTPAEKAGLRAGDRIVEFGGEEIRDWTQLRAALGKRKPREEVAIVVLRGEDRLSLTIVLGG